MVTNNNNQTTKQPGDPSASLLLTSEKAVFCKNTNLFQCFPKAKPDKTSAEPLNIISYFTLKAGEEEVEVTARANSDCPPPPRQPAPPPLDFLPHCKVRVKRAGAKHKKFSGI